MKKTISTLVLVSMLSSGALWASSGENTNPTQAQSSSVKEAIQKEQQKQTTLLEKVNTNVVAGMEHVLKAIKLLEEKKDDEALSALETAVGKFEIALAAEPDLKLAPVDGYVTLFDLVATPDFIKQQIKEVQKLLDEGKVQEARILLSSLRDEMVISTVYMPMGTYPDAIRLAVKYLRDKKRDQAIATLDTTVNSLVTKSTSIPLGLIRAKSLIEQASKLDKDKGKEKILKLVKAAREQLEVANLLGYTQGYDPAYIDLKKQLVELEKEIKGKNMVEKLYEKLADSFADLLKKEASHSKK